MAILYYRTIRNLFLGGGILFSATTRAANERATFAFTVFSGVQPSAATITSTWTNYNTTFLAHWQGIQVYQPSYSTTDAQSLSLYSGSSSSTAANSGTASWAIMWPTNPSQATISGSTLPSTSFIVLPASALAGTGMIRFSNTSFVSGNSYTIDDINIAASGGV